MKNPSKLSPGTFNRPTGEIVIRRNGGDLDIIFCDVDGTVRALYIGAGISKLDVRTPALAKHDDELVTIAQLVGKDLTIAKQPVPRLVLHTIDPDEDLCMMPWDEFAQSCHANAFTDDDGFGDLATATHVSNLSVSPSQAVRADYHRPQWATHVSWYNK